MKKLLVNGAGYTEVPLIVEAKKMGFFVIVTGCYKNPIGSKYADKYIEVDYSNREAILSLVLEEQIDFIIPGCNDHSILTAAYISEKLNLGNFDSYETTKIIHHKDLFKEFALKNELSVPAEYNKLSKEIALPVIVKPIDMSGGKGTSVVHDLNELNNAIDIATSASRNNKIIIEQYIEGKHYSAYLLIKDKKVIFDFFALEYFYLNKFMVAGAHSTFDLSTNVTDRIISDIEKMSGSLNLVDGLIHVQFIVSDDLPYILEVTRRSPGGLFSMLVDYTKGTNVARAIIKAHIGEEIVIDNNKNLNFIIRHCVMANKNGHTLGINYTNVIDKKIIDRFEVSSDKFIENYLIEMPEVIFLKMNSENECSDFVENFHKYIIFEEI